MTEISKFPVADIVDVVKRIVIDASDGLVNEERLTTPLLDKNKKRRFGGPQKEIGLYKALAIGLSNEYSLTKGEDREGNRQLNEAFQLNAAALSAAADKINALDDQYRPSKLDDYAVILNGIRQEIDNVLQNKQTLKAFQRKTPEINFEDKNTFTKEAFFGIILSATLDYYKDVDEAYLTAADGVKKEERAVLVFLLQNNCHNLNFKFKPWGRGIMKDMMNFNHSSSAAHTSESVERNYALDEGYGAGKTFEAINMIQGCINKALQESEYDLSLYLRNPELTYQGKSSFRKECVQNTL